MNVLKLITLQLSEIEFWERTEREEVQKNRHLSVNNFEGTILSF